MFRVLRIALFAAIVGAMSFPVFAVRCSECDDLGNCVLSPGSGTVCHFCIDCCWVTSSPSCTRVADQDSLAGNLAIASVEVARPSEATAVVESRIAGRRSASKVSETSFKR
jgi:hypothetical protein